MMATSDTPIHFFDSPCKAWEAIYTDCQQARTSIICEHYILDDDPIGHRFLDLFIEKAHEGLEIVLVLDGIGSRRLINSPKITNLRQAGAIVHFYNPPTFWLVLRPWRWLPRNHNKIVLIDHQIGHIGSACIQYTMRDWRDMHARFNGSLASELYNKIQKMVAHISRKPFHQASQPRLHTKGQNTAISYAISQPYLGRNRIYKTLLQRIRQAQHRILLVTPYFLPPYRLRRALVKAAKRGVHVTLMISEKTDVPITDCVSRSYLPYLLRHDIHVFLYKKTVLHAKYVVIDDAYAMLGSTNLDYLSLLRNHETNMIIYHASTIEQMAEQFHQDILDCRPVDWNYWHQLPWLYRMLGYMGRIARKVM